MKTWNCGRYQLPIGRKTLIMGILNVTPDSFSGDGQLDGDPLRRAEQLIQDGADILDIGGESTRPGSESVSAEEELRRVLPVIKAAAPLGVPISIDTTKAIVAVESLAAGACIVNDISGATFDERMLPDIAASGCGVILMHLRGTPWTMGASERAGNAQPDVIAEVQTFWRARIEAAHAAGITDDRIALDAGFGFGKSVEENLDLIRRGRELAAPGYPTLSGTSRKSTIGKLLGGIPPEERLMGSAALAALAVANGADMIRVHDVREMAQVARVADAVVRG
jgi:dihydropteroate synthase